MIERGMIDAEAGLQPAFARGTVGFEILLPQDLRPLASA